MALIPVLLLFNALTAAAPEPPKLQSPQPVPDAGWRLRWTAEPGVRYRLDASPSLPGIGLWSPLTTIQAAAGSSVVTHDDLPPAGTTSRFYRLAIVDGDAGETRTLANTRVSAGSFAAGPSGTFLPVGGLTVGLATIPDATGAVMDPATARLTGTGTVALPRLGTVVTGAFNLDATSGWITGTPPAEVILQPLVILRPRTLEANVLTGELRGDGRLEVALAPPGAALQSEPTPTNLLAVLDGGFSLDPTNRTVRFTGSATYRGVTLTGEGTLRLDEAVFDLAGTVLIGPGTEGYTLLDAALRLKRPTDAEPFFEIEGSPNLPTLQAPGVRLTGTLARNGSLRLTGSGAGALDALRFGTLAVTLERLGLPGAGAILNFNGSLSLPRVGGTTLAGRLLANGALANVVSTEAVTFGALRVRPRAPDQPVLRLLASTGFRHTFVVRGEFLTPAENGTQPVEVTGPLVVTTAAAELDIESMRLTNAIPIPAWPLPRSLRLSNLNLVLSLTNALYEARMRAQVAFTRELTTTNGTVQRPTLLGLDTAMAVNPDNPEDVALDAALHAERIPLLAKAYLRNATFRLITESSPPRATLTLVDGSVGLFPKYDVEPPAPGRDDFRLYIDGVGAGIEFAGERFSAVLTNGTLHLPTLFTNQPAGLCAEQQKASVAIGTDTAITLDFDPLPEPDLTIRARGSLEFRNLTFAPGLDGFGAELCRATLAFNPGGFPYLTNLQGAVQIPLPPGQTNRVELLNGAWELDGWPSGTIALMTDLRFYEGRGMTFSLLGRRNSTCPTGTALTVRPGDGFRPRTLVLEGGIQAVLPADLVTEVDGDRVSALACARLTLPAELPLQPTLELLKLEFAGSFHLGGGNGLLVTNSVLTLENLDNLFELAPDRTMVMRVTGTVAAGNLPALTLNDARFTFFDPARLPRFDVAGLGYDERSFPLLQKIPARLTKVSFTFDNREAEPARLFHPTNINLTVSGILAFPTTGDPMFETSFDDAKLDVGEKGAAIFKGLDGLAMTLRGLDIPPLDDIGGRVFASGLSGGASSGAALQGTGTAAAATAAPPAGFDLDKLFLAGRVSGNYQGYKVDLIVAFRINGMVGVCVDFNAGSVGIPIDAGYLGGVLLTGASGGIAFGTGFIDPCEFTSYLGPDGKPKPGVTALPPIVLDWEDLKAKVATAKEKFETFKGYLPDNGTAEAAPAESASGPLLAGPALASFLPHARYTNSFGLPCPGDCPPTTINIFCQPHPDEERFPRRVIARFTSIDEPTLNRLGFTRDSVRTRFAQGGNAVLDLPVAIARAIRAHALSLTPLPDPAALGPKAAEIQGHIDEALTQLEDTLADLLRPQLAAAAATGADALYDAIRDAAYEGVPCPDLTLTLSGTLTHTFVSSFLSGTVGAAISTAGSAGISGKVNVLGVPFGRAKGFISATDDQGDLNPSMCAEVEVSVGPFELGTMRGSYAIENGPAGVLRVFDQLTRCLGDTLFADLVRQVAPRITVTGRTRIQMASDLTPQEKIAFIAQLYSRPGLPGELRACFRDGLAALMRDINPEILFCGEIQPKLFSFPLGQSLFEGGLQVTKTEFTGVGSYSPSGLMAIAMLAGSSSVGTGLIGSLGGPLAATLFSPDQATYGIGFRVPDPLDPFLAGIDGRLQSPAAAVAYIDSQFDSFLENATYTFAYSLSPLGFKTVEAQMRVVLPNLTAHPARPGSTWIRPENRPGNPLPSRLDLVLSALTNRLSGSSLGLVSDPQWRGTATDLGQAFAPGSAQRTAVAGLSFANDYFPHGGVLGGAYIQIPRAVYEAPAPELATTLDPANDVFTRLGAAVAWIQDYVLVSRQAGALGFYLPAPNPPVFTDRTGAPLTPRALLEAIRTRELNELNSPGVYPGSEMFLRGWIDGQLLGVPIAKGDLEAALADAQAGTEGLFRVRASVPQGSWLDAYSPGARLEFELRQAPPRPIQDNFQALLNRLVELRAGNPPANIARTAVEDVLTAITNGLPRVKLEAELPLQFPAAIRPIAEFNGGTFLYAYSPRFEPGFAPADSGPRARARRGGGLAFRGQLNLRALGTTVASIPSAELSLVPRNGAPPAVSGVFDVAQLNVPALPLRNAHIEFATEPNARFAASGISDPIAVGPFLRIESPTGGSLTGRVEVVAPATLRTSLRPARIRILNNLATVYGETPGSDFSFRTDAPWAATVELGTSLALAAGGVTLVDLQSTGVVSPIRLEGNGTTSGTVSAELRGGSTLTFFPGQSYAQRIVLGTGREGRVIVRSDGTFEVTGTAGQDITLAGLNGLPIATLGNGSTFRLTQDALSLSGQLGGGVLAATGGPSFGGAGTVTIRRDGTASATAAGAFAIPAITFGRFTLDAPAGGPIAGILTPTGLSFTGARFRFDGLATNQLAAFAMDRQGNFTLDHGPVASSLGPFAFSSLQFRLVRTNGTLSVTNYIARWQAPGMASPVDLRGYLGSDGRIALAHSLPALGLAGFSAGPVDLALERQAGTLSTPIAASNPRAWWSFNETSGSTALNRVNSAANGTYSGAILPDAKDVAAPYPDNASARFGGGHIKVDGKAFPDNLPAGFSIAAWIKVAAFDRTWNTIASKGDSSWRLQRDGTRSALGFDTDGLNPPYLAGTRAVDDGRWHHVAAVYDGRAKYLWIDGELDAWTPASGTIAANTFPLLLGENSQSTGRRWNGWIDELALYDRPLAVDEIIAQVRAGAGLVVSGVAQLTAGGLSEELRGTVSPSGGMAFQASRSSSSFGGFATQDATFRLLRSPAGTSSVLLDGTLALPGVPPARIAGTLAPSGLFDLQASAPSGQFGAITLSALQFRLRGIPPAVNVSLDGTLDIAGHGILPLAGQLSADGNLSLTNLLAGAGTLFNFPVRDWEQVLRRQPGNYRALIAGDPLVPADRGTDPVAYWRLDETSGSTAGDSKKTSLGRPAIPGVYTGGVTLGQPGALAGPANNRPAARFDGTDDHVVFASESPFDFTSAVSVVAWVRVNAWTRDWQAIVTKGDSAWRLSRYSNTRRVSFDTTSAAGHHSLPGTLNLDDGAWHHVAAVYDGRAKYLFVDGALDGFAIHAETLNRNDAPVMIGENAEARGRYFNGWLDEVAVYGRSLTPAEIGTQYLTGGGLTLSARTQLALDGVQLAQLTGLIHPRGAASLGATVGSLAIAGFRLDKAYAGLHRVPGLGAVAQFAGGVTTTFGTASFSGTGDASGNYSLFSATTGSLAVGGLPFTQSGALELTRPQIQGSGSLAYGGLNLSGSVRIPAGGGGPSFTGSASDSTPPVAFGRKPNGSPGHPYAWVTWSVSGNYDPKAGSVGASVSGTLTVEYEVPKPGGFDYPRKSFGFGPLKLGTDGAFTVTPGETFNGIGQFNFHIP